MGVSVNSSASRKKAQVGIEYLILVSVLLAIIIIGVSFAWLVYNNAIANSSMLDSVQNLKQTANYVNALGPGSSLIAEINLPTGVLGGMAKKNSIDYNVQIGSGPWYYNAQVDGNISETPLPTTAGGHRLRVSMVNGIIVIQEV